MRSDTDLKAATQGYLDKDERLRMLERSAQAMEIEGACDYWYRVCRRPSEAIYVWKGTMPG
jgi:hypothetical protein